MNRLLKTNDPMTCLAIPPMTTSTSTPVSLALPDPKLDGTTHINVHYKHSNTPLGRQLSTFYVARFAHPYFGPFKCIEGLLLYAKTGCRDDEFRILTGGQAKAYYHQQLASGKLKNYEMSPQQLSDLMLSAYYARLTQHPVTAIKFKDSLLPFDSYYLHDESKLPIRPQPESGVLVHTLMTIRELLQRDQTLAPLPNEEYAKLIMR